MQKTVLPEKLQIRAPSEKEQGGNVLEISWSDRSTTASSAFFLRTQCPCASCEGNAFDGIPSSIKITAFAWVGNYAVQLFFSDSHSQGIYTYKTLQRLNEKKG